MSVISKLVEISGVPLLSAWVRKYMILVCSGTVLDPQGELNKMLI